MCVYGHVIFVFNECFIFVGPIFPLERRRTLKVGFLFPLPLITTCHVRGGCAQKLGAPARVSKGNTQRFHVSWKMQNGFLTQPFCVALDSPPVVSPVIVPFYEEERKAQGGRVTSLRAHSWEVTEGEH